MPKAQLVRMNSPHRSYQDEDDHHHYIIIILTIIAHYRHAMISLDTPAVAQQQHSDAYDDIKTL